MDGVWVLGAWRGETEFWDACFVRDGVWYCEGFENRHLLVKMPNAPHLWTDLDPGWKPLGESQ